jgi:putative transposase
LTLPNPIPQPITLTFCQKQSLEKLARRQSCSQQLVRRVKIILEIASGKNNHQIANLLGIHRETVRSWRGRWLAAKEVLLAVEAGGDDKELLSQIELILADELRSGKPAKFSLEQILAIVAIACEPPEKSGYPLSHWTPKTLREEAIKRQIISNISIRQVGRFLKRSSTTTTSSSLLA